MNFIVVVVFCMLLFSINAYELKTDTTDIIVTRVADKFIAKPNENITLSTIIYNRGYWTITEVKFFFIVPFPSRVISYSSDNFTNVSISRIRPGFNISIRSTREILPKTTYIHNVTIVFETDGNYTITGGRLVLTMKKGEYVLEKVVFQVNDIHIVIKSAVSSRRKVPEEGTIDATFWIIILLVTPFILMKISDLVARTMKR